MDDIEIGFLDILEYEDMQRLASEGEKLNPKLVEQYGNNPSYKVNEDAGTIHYLSPSGKESLLLDLGCTRMVSKDGKQVSSCSLANQSGVLGGPGHVGVNGKLHSDARGNYAGD